MIRQLERVSFLSSAGPEELRMIQAQWAQKAMAYGDVGSCVLGAGFEFTFEGKRYFMPPESSYQGSISWEHCKNEIQELLLEAGATDLMYHWGNLD